MQEQIVITRMNETHLEQVHKLYDDNFSEKWSMRSLALELEIEMARTLVATMGDVVVGFVNVRHVLGDGDINNIAVLEKYRKNHIGIKLMDALFELGHEEDITSYTLEVRSQNTVAIKFYESIGFKATGVRKNYYVNPQDDAILYRFELKGSNTQ